MPAIDRRSPIPLYYQLKLHLQQQMEKGQLRAGDRLPTEAEMCELYDISRAPVRQAMADLVREGTIYRRAGLGTFVAPLNGLGFERKTVMRVLAHYDVRWMATLEEAISRWNTLHPEHEVRMDLRMCAREEFHNVLQRAVIQGEAPDIVPLDYVWVAHYAADGYLTPLSDLDAVWADELAAGLETLCRYNNTFDDKLYGVPVQADITGLWYRKDWLECEGLTPPRTWHEWLCVLDHFATGPCRERLGYQAPLVVPVSSVSGEATVNLLIAFLWMCGGDVIDADGNLTLNSPAVHEALYFLQSITVRRRAYLPDNVHRARWWDLARFFALGQVPMSLGGSYEWPRIRDEADWSEEEEATQHLGFGFLPRPTLETPLVGSLGGTSWVVFRQSSHQDLALELLKLLSNPEVAQAFCEENLQISSCASINQRIAGPQHSWLSHVVPMLAHARPRPRIAGYLRLSNLLQDMFERTLWHGADVEATVQRTEDLLRYMLAR
jgi:multiple sugar transport system substrate-binding protein